MNTVILVRDALDQNSVEHLEVDNVFEYFMQIRADCPTARIYHREFSLENDVTPYDQLTAKRFLKLEGRFIIVRYAAGLDPITWLIIGAVTAAISVAITLLMPMPNVANQNNTQASPNNELASRKNTPRIKARIPDIYGTNWITPDLLAVPYTVYENNVEVEYCTMAVGRGYYDIDSVYDDKTRINDIDGSSAQFYDPNSNITNAPFYSEGAVITSTPLSVQRSSSVNGQSVPQPNEQVYSGKDKTDIYFGQYGHVFLDQSKHTLAELADIDFRTLFAGATSITLSGADFTYTGGDGATTASLDGSYTIGTLDRYEITLSDYASVKGTEWEIITALDGNKTKNTKAIIEASSENLNYVGPYTVESNGTVDRLILNFVALNGLFADSGTRKFNMTAEILLMVAYLEEGNVIGNDVEIISMTGQGQKTIGKTYTHMLRDMGADSFKVKLLRGDERDYSFNGTIIDEVKWSALYAASPFASNVYEHITVARTRTVATSGALSVKERKLNLLGTRKLYSYRTGEQSLTRAATNNAADIIINMALDPYIGRRSLNEVDVLGIYAAIDANEAYFGTPLASEFCYTFDDDKMSFEESIAIIANAVFCDAYRMSNKLHLQLEKSNINSKVLFNHRNKAPRSETHTISFGIENNHDGVEYEYTNPEDDSTTIISLPTTNLNNAKKIKGIGVRNGVQAHFAAWRAWHKLKYQYEKVRFTAYGEADLVTLKDRILVADNTRTGTQDGEIENVVGLVVTTSQPVKFEAGKAYTIHLQLKDGSVDSLTVSAGSDNYHLVLSRAPLQPLVYGDEYVAKTAYMITDNTAFDTTAYLVAAKSPQAKFVTEIEAVNYDWRYYEHDTDFINNLI